MLSTIIQKIFSAIAIAWLLMLAQPAAAEPRLTISLAAAALESNSSNAGAGAMGWSYRPAKTLRRPPLLYAVGSALCQDNSRQALRQLAERKGAVVTCVASHTSDGAITGRHPHTAELQRLHARYQIDPRRVYLLSAAGEGAAIDLEHPLLTAWVELDGDASDSSELEQAWLRLSRQISSAMAWRLMGS